MHSRSSKTPQSHGNKQQGYALFTIPAFDRDLCLSFKRPLSQLAWQRMSSRISAMLKHGRGLLATNGACADDVVAKLKGRVPAF